MPVELAIDDEVELPVALRRALRGELARMVRAAGPRLEVAVRLCDDAAIRVLNAGWRGKDKPTDVLAFAQRPRVTVPRRPGERPVVEAATADSNLLGDIVISLDTARRQARRGLHAELLHLASHGLCHLLGYDHRDDAEERVMNARAAELRAAATGGRSKPTRARSRTRRTGRGRAARA
ncbi:MAG TPA: rRNA maturation RNase YbeY [Kofleriaceae bacterium]|nr:rRNA maturation RNase YbeY [Kofleriaceae bacterium]